MCLCCTLNTSLHEGIVIGFVNATHVVEEQDSDFRLDITLFKSLETEQGYTIRLVGEAISAEENDFSVPDVFLFYPESETLEVFVTITGDRQIEQTETFKVGIRHVGGPSFEVDSSSVSTLISIVDNDGGELFVDILTLLCYYNMRTLPM